MGFLVLESEFGQRNSQWRHFGENNFCFTATPMLPAPSFRAVLFSPGIFRARGKPSALGRDLLILTSLGRSQFSAIPVQFPTPLSTGLGSFRGMAAGAALAAQGSGGGWRQLLAPACSSRHGFFSPAVLESVASRAADRAVWGGLGNYTTPFLIVPGPTARSLLL